MRVVTFSCSDTWLQAGWRPKTCHSAAACVRAWQGSIQHHPACSCTLPYLSIGIAKSSYTLFHKEPPVAGLIGIEYMISTSLWETLPEEEKKYWHSHKYEVCQAPVGLQAPLFDAARLLRPSCRLPS